MTVIRIVAAVAYLLAALVLMIRVSLVAVIATVIAIATYFWRDMMISGFMAAYVARERVLGRILMVQEG